MKKSILVLIMGILLLCPINVHAMIETDEDGNAIKKELKEGEVTILGEEVLNSDEKTVPEEDSNIIEEKLLDENQDKPASSSEQSVDSDKVYTILEEGNNNYNSESLKDSDENSFLPLILYSITGLAVGSGLTYLIMRKR